jgi:hypothetical protein
MWKPRGDGIRGDRIKIDKVCHQFEINTFNYIFLCDCGDSEKNNRSRVYFSSNSELA